MSVMNFQLPQRSQLVNGLSSLDAGVRLLPFGAAFPVGSVGSANIVSKLRVPGVYLVLAGAELQVIGYALLRTLDGSTAIQPAILRLSDTLWRGIRHLLSGVISPGPLNL